MQINFMLILSFFYGSSGRRAGRGGVAIVRGCSRTKRKIARRQVFWGVPFRYVCVRSRGISRLRSARSPRWRVFWDSRVRLVLFLMQGISRLTLEMTSCTFCFIMLFCKYRHRRLAHRGSLSGGRGTPLPVLAKHYALNRNTTAHRVQWRRKTILYPLTSFFVSTRRQ